LTADSLLETNEGDVVFQSVKDYIAHISTKNKYYCIAAPYIGVINDSCNTLATPPCSVNANMCSSASCSPQFSITLKENYGNAFANVIPKDY